MIIMLSLLPWESPAPDCRHWQRLAVAAAIVAAAVGTRRSIRNICDDGSYLITAAATMVSEQMQRNVGFARSQHLLCEQITSMRTVAHDLTVPDARSTRVSIPWRTAAEFRTSAAKDKRMDRLCRSEQECHHSK